MKKLLVATDLSSRSDRAVLRAIKLAKSYDAHLTILHIIDEDTPKELLKEAEKTAKQEINYCLKGRTKDLKFDTKIIVGVPHVEILNTVTREKIDLVILGIHRHTKRKEPLIGNIIERVVKHTLKPVLIVTNRAELDYDNILIGVDFNSHSKKSLKLAFGLFKNSRFHLVHTYFMPFLDIVGDTRELEEVALDSSIRGINSMVKESLKEIGKLPGRYKINQQVKEGSITTVLKEEFARLKPELLVLGTHGRSGLAKAIIGSVTEKFLANPLCDILVVM